MATEMEKDVLIEYVGSVIVSIKDDNVKIEYLKNLRETIYSTSFKNLDYQKIVKEIKEIKNLL